MCQKLLNTTEYQHYRSFSDWHVFYNLSYKKRSFWGIVHCLSAIEKGRKNWIRHVQKDLPDDNKEIHDRDHAEVDVTIGNF